MESIKNQTIPIMRLTEGEGHYFFGYYDVAAFDQGGKYHLYHKVAFMDRAPTMQDTAELGLIDIESRQKVKIAETTAWNFQEGAMFQWNPARPDQEVIYNIRDGESYRAVIKDVRTQKERILKMPVASVDPKGRYALSINFARLFDFRPGYGYHGIADIRKNADAPADDGVFRIDMADGAIKLIISLEQIQDLLKSTASIVKGKIVINQITCNPNGNRFVILARNFAAEGYTRGTVVITANADGSAPFVLSDYAMASHYHWRDEQYLLIYATHAEGNQLYLLRDKTRQYEIVDREFFKADGHCSYSPDRTKILYDSYPKNKVADDGIPENSCRHLYVYDVRERKGRDLAAFYSVPSPLYQIIRCDLHPRWHPKGGIVSFDSTHEKQRHIYLVKAAK